MRRSEIESMINALHLPALFIDEDARILTHNELAKTVLGVDVSGRNYVVALRQPSVLSAIEQCIETQQHQHARYLNRDGDTQTAYDLHCAFVGASHNGVLVTLTDITDAERTDQLRSDFVANVSHELRTPLTAVMGFIETLQGPAKEDRKAQERFLGIMAAETSRMNRLVDDLLSLSRVEAQGRSRPSESVAIADLLTSIVTMLQPIAQSNAATLSLGLETDGMSLRADSDQLRQVFVNLIENALKYGGQGVAVTVTLHAPRFEPRLRSDAIRISVADTGVGFDPIHIPRLTERFYRIDSHRSREMGGTGLGLAIAKHIINRHRGRMEVRSDIGQGAEFTVILPVSD